MHVTRRRRRLEGTSALRGILRGKRLRLLAAGGVALALTTGGIAAASTVGFGTHTVGSTYSDGSVQVSDDQTINPLGDRLETPFGKIMGSAISPTGHILATTSTDHSVDVQMFNLDTYQPVSAAGTAPVGDAKTANTFVNAAVNAGFPSMTYVNTPAGQTSANTCTPGGTSADGTIGQGNPTFSRDGSKLWVPVACGFDVYSVDATGNLSAPSTVFLPVVTAAHPIVTSTANPFATTTTELALTAGSVFGPDGNLYAALNGQDAVDEIDPATGSVLAQWKVGVAPRQLSFVDGKLYVANEGGAANPTGTSMQSYGSTVGANGTTGSSTGGTVSVIDPTVTTGVAATITVGLHPTATYTDGKTLYVANTDDDTVSVIDPATNAVVQTISTQPWVNASDGGKNRGTAVGYEPDSIDLQNGHLLVSLGRADAIEVFTLGADAQDPVSEIGLIPTDYYPSGVFTDAAGKVVVANRRGIDARGPKLSYSQGLNTTTATGHGTHATTASLTRFTWPTDAAIKADTGTVFQQNGWSTDPSMSTTQKVTTCKTVKVKVKLKGKAKKKAKKHHKKLYKVVKKRVCSTRTVTVPSANPVPTQIGQASSKIKHVFLIVKENRTYDQLFGDMKQGNGDPTLAQFGQEVTPNQHALATQFGLYDNTYDIGTNSAEGHNWMMMGDNPEYTESSAGEYTRSYDTEEDVLGHQRSGFLWSAVQAAGATAKNYGEYEYGEGKPAGSTWQQYYCAATAYDAHADASPLTSGPLAGAHYGSVIPSLNAISDPLSPAFDTSIPDIYREAIWEQDFKSQLASSAGAEKGVPNFNMMWFSSDHTSGQASPEAQAADNDVAVGRVVDEISHSSIWKDSVVFVAEDDSQAGADHVDGHRAPIQVISPWAQHGKVVDTYYSQISMVRTIEQILGAQPLNEKVAAATPMYGAFSTQPNNAPYNSIANQVPLTEGLSGGTPACGNDTLGRTGAAAKALQKSEAAATDVPAAEQAVANEWDTWAAQQHLSGAMAIADYANPDLMNRYTWYRAHDWSTPYPGDTQIFAPSRVPGANVPNTDTDQ
ncbi:bifunctional YncE family protein/alkaline phosphatase family protein [Nocardioides sp. Iso805N]|uniref:bifunctional YncE family protein/alkaline phosphatase family protein n=1 Tax=Nocardioides sp. Iso805N TaxID=1283287 RepID=UPI00037C7C53|nr:alkaline phosphatase family protein [Nocardioides sp. Iso805N]